MAKSRGSRQVFVFKACVSLAIVCYWFVDARYLVRNELWPVLSQVSSRREGVASLGTPGQGSVRPQEDWMGIYLQGQKCGFSHSQTLVYSTAGGETSYGLRNDTFLRFVLSGKAHEVRTAASALLSSRFELQSFFFRLVSQEHHIQIRGRLQDKDFKIEIETGGVKKTEVLQLSKPIQLPFTFPWLLSKEGLVENQRFTLQIFNPLTQEVEDVFLDVMGEERLSWQGKPVTAKVARLEAAGLESKVWVGGDGALLKQETSLGWTLIKEEYPQVLNMPDIDLQLQQDILTLDSVPVDRTIAYPRSCAYLRLKLEGIDIHDFLLDDPPRQRLIDSAQGIVEINREALPSQGTLPVAEREKLKKWLGSSAFIQADSQTIQEEARKIVGWHWDSLGQAIRINAWIYKNLRKKPVVSVPSALEVLQTKEGDCNEHAILFAALARSLGIPTKILTGVIYHQGRFYYHVWVACCVGPGQWVTFDPTLGQIGCDATHVQCIEGELKEQMAVIKLLGKLKITVEEYR